MGIHENPAPWDNNIYLQFLPNGLAMSDSPSASLAAFCQLMVMHALRMCLPLSLLGWRRQWRRENGRPLKYQLILICFQLQYQLLTDFRHPSIFCLVVGRKISLFSLYTQNLLCNQDLASICVLNTCPQMWLQNSFQALFSPSHLWKAFPLVLPHEVQF